MFTWICPQCGREVPPAYNECPDCAAKAAAAPGPPAPTDGGIASVPDAPPMPQAALPRPPQYAPRPRAGASLPTWVLALLFAVGFGGLLGGVYWYVNSQHNIKPSATVESPAAKPGAKQNPVQKYIEISGVRFARSSKGTVVTFLLINHSDSDLVGLAGNVTIWGRTQKSEEDAVGTFAFQTSMQAQSSKELSLPFTTKLKLIELPDWQNVTVDVQITAPPGA